MNFKIIEKLFLQMTEKRIGFKGLVTTLPILSAESDDKVLPAIRDLSEFQKTPFLGSIPKSNISANLPQIILDWIASISFILIIICSGFYSWSIYCDYEYQKITDITNSKIVEQMPPLGAEHSLNRSELLYCFAENKRLESQRESGRGLFLFWRTGYKQYADSFGLHCAHKKYRLSDLGDVKKIYNENIELYERQGTLR